MDPKKRFLFGGAGALLPVFVSILALDLAAIFNEQSDITIGNIIGFGVRYTILFFLGGFIAYLHDDEIKPFKLVELGVAAPALITSLVTAQVANQSIFDLEHKQNVSYKISLINSAHASEYYKEDSSRIILAGLFDDIYQGFSGKVYYEELRNKGEAARARAEAEIARARAEAAEAETEEAEAGAEAAEERL